MKLRKCCMKKRHARSNCVQREMANLVAPHCMASNTGIRSYQSEIQKPKKTKFFLLCSFSFLFDSIYYCNIMEIKKVHSIIRSKAIAIQVWFMLNEATFFRVFADVFFGCTPKKCSDGDRRRFQLIQTINWAIAC